MCARLLSCPLCSQPSFLTLDAMRAGLVSVTTRPLGCPVCNDILLGIDKLTIHLFSHTINTPTINETAEKLLQARNVRERQREWNVNGNNNNDENNSDDASVGVRIDNDNRGTTDDNTTTTTSGFYIPIDEIENFRSLNASDGGIIPVTGTNGQVGGDLNGESGQVIFLQNVATSRSKIFTANCHEQILSPIIYQTIAAPTTTTTTTSDDIADAPMEERIERNDDGNDERREPIVITVDNDFDNNKQNEYPPSHTDRLADLVKNAQIASSPLGTFHEAFDCSKPESSPRRQQSSTSVHRSTTTPTSPTSSSSSSSSLRSRPASPKNESKRTKQSRQVAPKTSRYNATPERNEICDACGFTFPDRTILLLHKQLVHASNNKEAKTRNDTIVKNYHCHLCTKVFKMRGSLMVHMRVAHPGIVRESKSQNERVNDQDNESPDVESGYSCPTCGKIFRKEQQVVQHLKIHDGRQYECEICSKMFTTKYFLKKHKRLHSGEMPYKCTICDKTFTFQQSFHKHRLYHKEEKPHACATCGRTFKELSTLHNHERIHTGEKPFVCETCGKSFRQRVSYLVHQRIHTGIMPYKCTACHKSFRYKVSQRTHKCPQMPPGIVVQQFAAFSQKTKPTIEGSKQSVNSSSKDRSTETSDVNEENQYVFIVSEKSGGHELKRKASAETVSNVNEEKSCPERVDARMDVKDGSSDTSDFLQSILNQDSNGAMINYKDCNPKQRDVLERSSDSNGHDDVRILEDGITKHFTAKVSNDEFAGGIWSDCTGVANYEKLTNVKVTNDTNDLFSIVMSPLDDEILSSPSNEMEHLRLSSPRDKQDNATIVVNDCFPTLENNNNNNNPSAVRVDCNDVERNFEDNNGNLSTLQSINEDSLKELLYGITER